MEFRILDLFCGAGGFSYGMHKNGHFSTVVAVDINGPAAHTFRMNMPDASVIVGDITDPEIKDHIIKESRFRNVNMIIGGPPCQGFSMKGKKMGLEDPRNFLFKEYLGIVEALQPDVFVIENVKSLLSTARGWFRDEILAVIGRLGYEVSYGVLNARRFGVPQNRERAIFICSKDIKIPLPEGSDGTVTVRDAISDLSFLASGEGEFESDYPIAPQSDYQAMMREGALKLFNHKASDHSDLAVSKLMMIPPESGKEYLPPEMHGRQRFRTTWGRLSWNKVSPTVDTRFDTPSNGTNSHPYLHRAITPREAARLQSFDDRFIFHGSKFYIRSQIGNAVPPLMAKAIADSIYEAFYRTPDYEPESHAHENSLPTDYKKANGIFYTDLRLAATIVDFLGIRPDADVIDPCCGTGAFLFALKNAGVTDLYGMDIDSSTARKCSELTGLQSVFCIDSITRPGSDTLKRIRHRSFDYVVGNPPYVPLTADTPLNSDNAFNELVANSGNNLFVAAVYRSFELCRPGGLVSLIVPKNLLHIPAYTRLRHFLLQNSTIMSVIELGIHFRGVRGEQIVLTCRNASPDTTHKVKFYRHSHGSVTYISEFPQAHYEDEIIVFDNEMEPAIYSRLKALHPLLGDLCAEPIRRGRSRGNVIRGKDIRKFGLRSHNVPREGARIFIQNIFSAESGIIAAFGGNLPAGETVTVVNAGETEMAAYILGILQSRLINYYLIRFIFNNSRLTIHTDARYLDRLPVISGRQYTERILSLVKSLEKQDYMSERWLREYERLNETIYEIYGISADDRKYIEAEMAKISSSKWYPATHTPKTPIPMTDYKVSHNSFGDGTVKRIYGSRIDIDFSGRTISMVFPGAFSTGLKSHDQQLDSLVEAAMLKVSSQSHVSPAETKTRTDALRIISDFTFELIGKRSKSLDFSSNEELFELIGYLAKPGVVKGIWAEIPTSASIEFRSLFPDETIMNITEGSTTSGQPNKFGVQCRLNLGRTDNCPPILTPRLSKGLGKAVASRVNCTRLALQLVKFFGFHFGDSPQDHDEIRRIADEYGYLESFMKGYNR